MKHTSKRGFAATLIALLIFAAEGVYASVDLQTTPSGCHLDWTATEGAVFYDIYVDNQFVNRLDSNAREYEISALPPGEYDLAFAARDGENNTLSSDFKTFSPTGWDGIYSWTNTTDVTNKGKLTELVLRAETVVDDVYGAYISLYMIEGEEEYRIFPLFDLDSPPVGWTEYKADTPQAEAYRRNAEKFNTSPFTPSSWRVESITLDYENPTVTVETKALGFAVDTTVTYNFFVDENGKRNIRIMMDGSGIVRNFLLYNPEEGSDGSYILSEV